MLVRLYAKFQGRVGFVGDLGSSTRGGPTFAELGSCDAAASKQGLAIGGCLGKLAVRVLRDLDVADLVLGGTRRAGVARCPVEGCRRQRCAGRFCVEVGF